MKPWTEKETCALREMCVKEVSNADISKKLGRPLSEIHAKRSRLGLTVEKVKAMKAAKVKPAPKKKAAPAVPKKAAATPAVDTQVGSTPVEDACGKKITEALPKCETCHNPLCAARAGQKMGFEFCEHYQSKEARNREGLSFCCYDLLKSVKRFGTASEYLAAQKFVDCLLEGELQ